MDQINLTVLGNNFSTTTLSVNSQTTLQEIREQLNASPTHVMSFGGECLSDWSKTLKDCGINANELIYKEFRCMKYNN